MSIKSTPPRQKIILATIDCIGRDGIQSLTVRKIAAEAGVNSAAINYYFGSKENLIEMALSQTMDEMSGLPQEFLNEKRLSREHLQAYLSAVLEGVINYPGITKAHLYGPMMENDYSSPFTTRFKAFIEESLGKLKSAKLQVPTANLRMVLIQLVSAVVLPCLVPELFGETSDMDFNASDVRQAYVAGLVEHYFK